MLFRKRTLILIECPNETSMNHIRDSISLVMDEYYKDYTFIFSVNPELKIIKLTEVSK